MSHAPAHETTIGFERPRRWDVPFDPHMTDADVDRVLSIPPFSDIDASSFAASTPLRGILRNDARIVRPREGDILVRQGDYGSSAFFVISGSVRVVLDGLPPAMLGRRSTRRTGVLGAFLQLLTRNRAPEARNLESYRATRELGERKEDGAPRVFLQDVPGILDEHSTVQLGAGEFFGEIAALGRSPRTATVFADADSELLEIRWQGLRDIRRRADEIRNHIDALYRERSLIRHLQEVDVFKGLSEDQLERIAAETVFESFGSFEWNVSYKKLAQAGRANDYSDEPMIVQEGHYPNGLVLIRSGFVRVSRKVGASEQTMSYLGKGQSYGIEELAHNWRHEHQRPWRRTLRAIGYVDALRVPTRVIEDIVLPSLPVSELPQPLTRQSAPSVGRDADADALETGVLERLMELRLVNGAEAMVIDLDRCTRCDDCVRACASAHDHNPRFVRHGPKIGQFMIANACMHCADPVCMIGCPTGAIHRDLEGGQVVINDNTCIGCSTCADSCPYHNIRMVEIRDKHGVEVRDSETSLPIRKATKCDLCVDLPGGPACQRACPHDALRRVDLRTSDELTAMTAR